MNTIIIDGAQGEGGGQVLRTSMTLAALTGQPIEIHNIRAGRKKPGLLRQHLTSVRAAAQISNGRLEGDELRSTKLRFEPGQIKAGRYHFVIGTAGSTTLVCQTILPLLMSADGESEVRFEGGTHNGMSPSLTFLQRSFLPILAQMGLRYQVKVHELGFNPAGGGKWTLKVQGNPTLKPFRLRHPPLPSQRHISGIVSNLPPSILEREFATVMNELDWYHATTNSRTPRTQGPGNYLGLHVTSNTHESIVEGTGEAGVQAEAVAKRLADKMQHFLDSGASVEEHLADQLLLPMLMVDGCEFITDKPSSHTLTNIAVIEQLTNVRIECRAINDSCYLLNVQ